MNLSDLEKLFDMQADSLKKMIDNVKYKESTIKSLQNELNRAKKSTKHA